MNKSELVKRVAKKLDDLPQKIAAKAVDAVFQSIQEGLEEDGIVKIGQWGTYTVDDLELKWFQNPISPLKGAGFRI